MKIVKIILLLLVLVTTAVVYSCKDAGNQIVNLTGGSPVGLPEPDLSCGSAGCLE